MLILYDFIVCVFSTPLKILNLKPEEFDRTFELEAFLQLNSQMSQAARNRSRSWRRIVRASAVADLHCAKACCERHVDMLQTGQKRSKHIKTDGKLIIVGLE